MRDERRVELRLTLPQPEPEKKTVWKQCVPGAGRPQNPHASKRPLISWSISHGPSRRHEHPHAPLGLPSWRGVDLVWSPGRRDALDHPLDRLGSLLHLHQRKTDFASERSVRVRPEVHEEKLAKLDGLGHGIDPVVIKEAIDRLSGEEGRLREKLARMDRKPDEQVHLASVSRLKEAGPELSAALLTGRMS
jgi:hypothetical protein